MPLIQISKRTNHIGTFALFEMGFRPFFIGAAVLAIVSLGLWIPLYSSYVQLPVQPLSLTQWHSHEMIYGYALAVIAGFLLTAVMNWTGVRTLHGVSLCLLVSLWALGRLLFLFGSRFIALAALTDMLFVIGLTFSIAHPIIRVRQWRQLGILSKVVLLGVGNLCFYLGAFGYLENGAYLGIYGGLYVVVALILVIGGRVFPGFIRNAVGQDAQVSTPGWVVVATLLLFVLFFINQLFIQNRMALGYVSSALFVITTVRLFLLHTAGIWKRPLLWSLFLSLVFINFGFLLYALSVWTGTSPFLAVHAFAVGGIGVVTVGMMSRVSVGHTGRSIHIPSPLSTSALVLLLVGAVIRVVFPLVYPLYYTFWLLLAQLAWIVAFALFLIAHGKMLLLARVDGQAG